MTFSTSSFKPSAVVVLAGASLACGVTITNPPPPDETGSGTSSGTTSAEGGEGSTETGPLDTGDGDGDATSGVMDTGDGDGATGDGDGDGATGDGDGACMAMVGIETVDHPAFTKPPSACTTGITGTAVMRNQADVDAHASAYCGLPLTCSPAPPCSSPPAFPGNEMWVYVHAQTSSGPADVSIGVIEICGDDMTVHYTVTSGSLTVIDDDWEAKPVPVVSGTVEFVED